MMMVQCESKHVAIQSDILLKWSCVCLVRFIFVFHEYYTKKGMIQNGFDISLHRN
jgi:hypothetical protein